MSILLPNIPENMPRMGNRLSRWLGRICLRCLGWQVSGNIPNYKQLMVVAAPHTSNWDFIIAIGTFMALGVRVSYLMKKEAFFWPFKDFFAGLGGIAVDRNKAEDTVKEITACYQQHKQIWFAIAPEGTRKKVSKWKTGFLRIALEANIPILLVVWDYPQKTLRLDKIWFASGDHDGDVKLMQNYINKHFCGKNPQYQ